MEWLRLIHGYHFNGPLGIFLSTPYAVATLVLFVWSLGPAIKGVVRTGFLVWLRLTWALTLIPAVTGVILAVGGEKVPSATDVGGGLSRYGLPADPSRDSEHWMYAALGLLSLYVIEVLAGGRMIEHRQGLRFLPLATFFLYCVAIRVSQVAVFPGGTPGT